MSTLDFSKIKWTGWYITYNGIPIPDGDYIPPEGKGKASRWRVDYFLASTPGKGRPPKIACTLIKKDKKIARFERIDANIMTDVFIAYKVNEDGTMKRVWLLFEWHPDSAVTSTIAESTDELLEQLKDHRLFCIEDKRAFTRLHKLLTGKRAEQPGDKRRSKDD